MRSLGIDLALQARTTAACVVGWIDGAATVRAIELGVDDERAIELTEEVNVVGIDAPFGWPVPSVELVERHQRSAPGLPT